PFGWGLALAVTASGAWFLGATGAFAADALWPVAGPLLGIWLGWSGQAIARGLEEARQRQRVEALFGQHVSPAVARRRMPDPDAGALGGERREMTVLFVDMRDSTAIADGAPPEAVVRLVNEFLPEMTACIFRYEGTVEKYTGDGLMAFWNAPEEQPDH